MKHVNLVFAASVVLAATLSAAPAEAQNTRSFVSGHGLDTNPCTLGSPCRTFAAAILQTNPGGEIAVLDTAGYGGMTITKAISIVNPGGVEAGIAAAANTDAITINAGPTDKIALRGLTVEGAGVGRNGIVLNSGANLDIANLVVRNFKVDGIHLSPNVNSTFSILNTIVSDNVGVGIFIIPTGAALINGVIDGVAANNNYDGILMDGVNTSTVFSEKNNTINVVKTVAVNNQYAGFYCAGAPGSFYTMVLQNVSANNNQYGIKVDGAVFKAEIFIFNSVSIGNSLYDAFSFNNGYLSSYGNNALGNNQGVDVYSLQ
jgi:hypothetical protein